LGGKVQKNVGIHFLDSMMVTFILLEVETDKNNLMTFGKVSLGKKEKNLKLNERRFKLSKFRPSHQELILGLKYAMERCISSEDRIFMKRSSMINCLNMISKKTNGILRIAR